MHISFHPQPQYQLHDRVMPPKVVQRQGDKKRNKRPEGSKTLERELMRNQATLLPLVSSTYTVPESLSRGVIIYHSSQSFLAALQGLWD